MPVQTSYPGVYVQEVPSGVRTIVGVSTSIVAFIGRTRQGPLDKPVRCLNFTDFERVFSSEDPGGDTTRNGNTARAIRLFFLNGGTECYVVRIANGALSAAVDLPNESGVNVVTASAKSPGTVGNTVRLVVDYNTRQPNATYNLEVFRWIPNSAGQMVKAEVENWKELSMDPAASQSALKVVNQGSKLVQLAALAAAGPASASSQSGRAIRNASPREFWEDWRQILKGIGNVGVPPVWTGTSVVTASGTYSGSVDKTFTFTTDPAGGTVGTDAIEVDWNDGAGNTGTLTLPVGYAGAALPVAEGLSLSFAPGTVGGAQIMTVPVQASVTGAVATGAGWTGTSAITASGGYTGPVDKTFTFTVTAGGTVETDAINLDWDDGAGNTGTLSLPAAYVADTPVPMAEGVNLAFGAGDLVDTETFTLPATAAVVGAVAAPATWTGTSAITASGGYIGQTEKTFTFTVAAGGTVETDAIDLNWDDGSGNTGTLSLPATYVADTPVPVTEGVSLAFGAGDLTDTEAFTLPVQPWGSRFRLSINNGLSFVEVNLDDLDFDNDPDYDDTATGAQANLAAEMESRITALLPASPAGPPVTVSMPTGPTANTVLLRLEAANTDIQVQPATTLDLTRALSLGASRGGLEVSRYSAARPAASAALLLAGGTDGNPTDLPQYEAAFARIDKEVDIFNLMVLPHDPDHSAETTESLWGPASLFCQQRRAFLLIDPPESWTSVQQATDLADGVDKLRIGLVKDHSAVFFPRVTIRENRQLVHVGPSGAIAGLMARIDSSRGVWKAPAGTEADLRGINGLEYRFSDAENGVLNPQGINTIRIFPNGIVNWGARTLDGKDEFASEWKYIPIRRTALFIEESLYRALKWVVFEPNDEPLWAQIRLNVGAFMHNLFRQGAFQGQKKSDAYFVKCDAETTTQNDINLGIVNIWVGFAPLKPAEFVILYLQQMTGQIQV